jgi:transposase
MLVKTILNHVEKHSSFVYGAVRLREGGATIEAEVRLRRGARPICSGCSHRRSVYDTMSQREFQFVPLWGVPVFLLYSMRRVNCRPCGVRVESVPWAEGKRRTTISFEWFLASGPSV